MSEIYDKKVKLCSTMVTKYKEDRELIIFPELPRWVVVSRGASEFLKKIDGESIYSLRQKINDEEFGFVMNALESGILVDSNLNIDVEDEPQVNPLISVWLNITSSCNLKCKHCFLGENNYKSDEVMSVNEIDSLMDEFLKVKGEPPIALDITGGEPLLRKDFIDIVKVCSRDGIKVSVPTNGLLLDSKIINELSSRSIPLVISLDGCTKEDHEFIRGSNTFDRTLHNISEAVSQGIDVTLSFTVHKGNQDSIIGYLEFAKKLGVNTVNYSFLNELGNALVNNMYKADENKVIHNTLMEALRDKEIFNLIQSSNCCRTLETVLLPIKMDCCGAGINTCAIGANGDIYPCPSFQNEKYTAGNIRKNKFSDVWNNSNTFKEFRKIRIDTLNDKCSKCELRFFCGGGCRAQASQGGKEDLNSHSSKCELYKKTIYDLMWLVTDYPELGNLKTEVGATYFH